MNNFNTICKTISESTHAVQVLNRFGGLHVVAHGSEADCKVIASACKTEANAKVVVNSLFGLSVAKVKAALKGGK